MNPRPFHALRWFFSQVIIIGLFAASVFGALYGVFLLARWFFS